MAIKKKSALQKIAEASASANALASALKELTGDGALHESMGEFICNYARIEAMCHMLFDRLSGLSPEVSRAMMGNARLADLTAVLTRIVDLSNLEQERKDEYHRCKNQLNAITEFRHRLIHRGAKAQQERIRSTNEFIAKSQEAIEVMEFHVDEIRYAASDCFRMEVRLLWLIVPDLKTRMGDEFAADMFGPWRYKHVEPSKPYQQPRKARQLKKRQQPSLPQ